MNAPISNAEVDAANKAMVAEEIAHGFKLCAIPPGTKGPRTKDWNAQGNELKSADDLPAGWGVGLLHVPSHTAVLDIDDLEQATKLLAERGIDLQALLDAPDAVQIISGKANRAKLLCSVPPFLGPLITKRITYRTAEGINKTAYELRCATADGLSVQDVLPPSIYPETLQPYRYGGAGDWRRLPTLPFELLDLWQSLIDADSERGQPPTADGIGNSPPWGEVESALRAIPADCSREEWIQVGMALSSTGNPAALSAWRDWSATGKKYKGEREINSQWRSFKPAPDGIGIGSLIHIAKQYGWVRPAPDASGLFSEVAPSDTKRFNLMGASEIVNRPRLKWIVKNAIPETGIAAIYGPSGSGKTFIAMDVMFAIADQLEWFHLRTSPRPIVYVALEGEAGLSNRVAAYLQRHGKIGERVHFLTQSIDLRQTRDVTELADAIHAVGAMNGVVVIDTLNRASPGMDENSSADMGNVIAAVKKLQEAVGGLILLVHHTGKDASKGLRGHSSLLAALDGAIEVSRDGDRREWSIAKAKDGEDGKAHPFRLEIVDLGIDEDGDRITSCVVVPEAAIGVAVQRARLPKGGNQKIILDGIKELLQGSADFGNGGAPSYQPCLELESALAELRGRIPAEDRRKTERARQALTGLISSGLVELREGWLWIKQ